MSRKPLYGITRTEKLSYVL